MVELFRRRGARGSSNPMWPLLVPLVLALPLLVGCTCTSDAGTGNADTDDAAASRFVIGAVLDFSGALAEHGDDAKLGAMLAAKHVNMAGGVLGEPLSLSFADGATDPDHSVKVARDLVENVGIHAMVGAMGSEATLRVASAVSVPERVPTISPSATAPALTWLEDDGYLFRAAASDAAQGPVLAHLAIDEGYRKMGAIYRDDAYGRGLLEAFAEHYPGELNAVAIQPDEQTTFLPELRQAAEGGSRALLVLAFPFEASIFVGEAVEHGLFERFLFADGSRSLDLIEEVGAEALQGSKGTAPALRTANEVESTRVFLQGFQESFGRQPLTGPAAATYDAVICLSLAAERAGQLDGPALRDALPEVCGGEGERFIARKESVAAALEAVRAKKPVNYDGASSSVDWDEAGDVTTGLISIWEYHEGTIRTLERVPFDLACAELMGSHVG